MSELFPDGFYRPIPIVWFARAVLGHICLLFACFFVFYAADPVFTWTAVAVSTAWVAWKTWARGMAVAHWGWKLATVAVLALNCAIVSYTASDRIPWS